MTKDKCAFHFKTPTDSWCLEQQKREPGWCAKIKCPRLKEGAKDGFKKASSRR